MQRSNSPISSSSTSSTGKEVQDLNLPPSSTTSTMDDDSVALDLKLVPSYDYRSVCTLDKVKSALERVKKRSSPPAISIDSSSEEEDGSGRVICTPSNSSGLLFAGGCPSCLMYVMISKTNPKCPRCDAIVPTPSTTMCSSKKPRLNLDLNLNLVSSSTW